MERDSIVAHGMTAFLRDSFLNRGEKEAFHLTVCNRSGRAAVSNVEAGVLVSPSADGPLQWDSTGTRLLTTRSAYTVPSVSRIHIPYALNLLRTELEAMNIDMRFVTSDAFPNQQRMTQYFHRLVSTPVPPRTSVTPLTQPLVEPRSPPGPLPVEPRSPPGPLPVEPRSPPGSANIDSMLVTDEVFHAYNNALNEMHPPPTRTQQSVEPRPSHKPKETETEPMGAPESPVPRFTVNPAVLAVPSVFAVEDISPSLLHSESSEQKRFLL